ncbi:putative YigZ family protein [Bacilli bacterium PM5-9]|nr:putative YigZ family protein [Bacilli bacterium PM5-9]
MLRTINDYVTNTIVIEKSRFICELFVIESEQQAKNILNEVRAKHPKAVHHCYAYVLKNEYQNIENQSDDGEPSKTAGLPMLEILRYEKLVNVLAVVTRYFGGTLLGTGGLIRAYSGSVKQAVDLASIKEAELMYGYLIKIDYHFYDKIAYDLKKMNAIIKETNFNDKVEIMFYIKDKRVIEYLKNSTNNSLEFKELDSTYL